MLLLTREEERYGEGLAVGEERGRTLGEAQGRSETLNALIYLMRTKGISTEQIDDVRLSFLKSIGAES